MGDDDRAHVEGSLPASGRRYHDEIDPAIPLACRPQLQGVGGDAGSVCGIGVIIGVDLHLKHGIGWLNIDS
jgi:hypothetical protein